MSAASASQATTDHNRARSDSAQGAAPAGNTRRTRSASILRVLPLGLALVVFGAASAYQLDLPGLHYDEAREAGVNAMQLLTGQPVTAFRNATVGVGPWRIPLMVQDYIGNLNVLLAVPFLAVGGINTVALRAMPLFLAALTLIFTWKVADKLGGSWVAAVAALLLAVNPSFIFWSRQGIFVTNITALFLMMSIWFGLLWWEQRRPVHLILVALCCGLGVYAKLLFVWAVIALFLVAAFVLALERRRLGRWRLPKLSTLMLAAVAFVLPLAPLILYNLRTSGTLLSLFGNLGRSYYGVDNSAYGVNLAHRLDQLKVLVRGDHFWYLGRANANEYAPWLLLALGVLAVAAWLSRTRAGASHSQPEPRSFAPALPLALLILVVLQSAFTVSDLFITHFALITPLVPLTAALSLGEVVRWAKTHVGWASRLAVAVAAFLIVAWAVTDAVTVALYHEDLSISGGFTAHSDAIYRLAEYLDTQGYRAPVVLDWGLDAPLRFLTADRVQPVDVFGYDRLDAPDPGFMERITPYLDDWETIFIAPPPAKAVFKGRLEAIEALTAQGSDWMEQARFSQRSGETLYFVHRFFR